MGARGRGRPWPPVAARGHGRPWPPAAVAARGRGRPWSPVAARGRPRPWPDTLILGETVKNMVVSGWITIALLIYAFLISAETSALVINFILDFAPVAKIAFFRNLNFRMSGG